MAKLPFNGWVAAAALGSAFIGLVAYDFERAIDRLDAIEANTKSDHEQVVLTKQQMEALSPRVGELELKVYDHELRIIKGGL